MSYGKFKDFETFLNSYISSRNENFTGLLAKQPIEQQLEIVRKTKNRDIVEVNAIISRHEPDITDERGISHYHLLINVLDVKISDPDVQGDIDRCMQNKAPVFVAIRYGDSMGILEPIKSGIDVNDKLDLKGEWITADKAEDHGGEKMSVLHFTHKPVGFICTTEKCYQ